MRHDPSCRQTAPTIVRLHRSFAPSARRTAALFVIAFAACAGEESNPQSVASASQTSTPVVRPVDEAEGAQEATSDHDVGALAVSSVTSDVPADGGQAPASTGSGPPDAGCAADADAGPSAGEAPHSALSLGKPIEAIPMKWQYVPFPKTRCRDGSPTGLAVNLNPKSDKLLFYLDQGGACFNDTTCAFNPTHWSLLNMLDPTQILSSATGILSRSDTNSPFTDWNIVYVPNCTGDAHMGTNPSGYMGQPQEGYLNLTQYLARVVPTFPKVSEVVLSGTSSGGFGAAFNWMRVQDAFGSIPVQLLDDSGPPIGDEFVTPCVQKKLITLWGLANSLHPACTECDLTAGHVIQPLLEVTMKRLGAVRRIAVLSNDEDSTMRLFFGYGLNDCKNFNDFLPPTMPTGRYPSALKALRESLSSYPNFAMYVVKGSDHIMVFNPGKISSAGVALPDFLSAFVHGGNTFRSVVP